AGCASAPHETVTIEKKKGVTLIHHRSLVGNGAKDRIEAVSANGSYSQAEIHVFDIGRYVDSSGNVHDAHRLYRTVQSQRPNLMLPRKVTGGPRTVYTPPNYVPPPQDQRITDAVSEAQAAKQKLDDASKRMNERLAEDNTLKGQLQDQISENQALQDKLNAAMATPQHTAPPAETDAQKAAESSTSALKAWGQQVTNQGG